MSENFNVGDVTKNGKATTGLVLGIVGLVAWFIPLIGAPITIIGLVFSIKGLKSLKRGVAIAGIVLSSIGLFATIVNASIGAYQGATGQNYIINKFTGKENPTSSSNNSGTSNTKSNSGQDFKIYTMSNSLKVSYPSNWTADQGENEYVVNLESKDKQAMIEVSYNVLPDGQSKNVNVWKTDVIEYSKANPELGIDQSSIEIKKIAGNNSLVSNQTTGQVYGTQVIIPIESSDNNKYIQFTLKTHTANLLSNSQVIFSEVITKTLLANIQ